MGKPVLGENCRLEVIIEESYDFKVIFWGLTFLESGLGHFLGDGLESGEPQGSQGQAKRGSHVRTTDSTCLPFPRLPSELGCGKLRTPGHRL